MAQIVEAANAVEQALPVRVRRPEQGRGRTPTRIEDESAYPIGGYSSISTIGGMESLVSSELIYMGDAEQRATGEVDLFEVRWAAGELLKYTRDESVHTRERRTLSFALCPELDRARIKDPSVPWQRLVVGLGAVVAMVRKLCAWLDAAELHLHLLFVARPPGGTLGVPQPLAPESALLALVLREYIEAGTVELIDVEGVQAAWTHAERATELGGSDLIWLLGGPTAELEDAADADELRARVPVSMARSSSEASEDAPAVRAHGQIREHGLDLDHAPPLLWTDEGRGPAAVPVFEDDWEAWRRRFAALALALALG
ncbi:hypothetical protein PPSIR1_14450 [Plesiocystis pacifica SIR-1]|uniref:FtsH ternary systems vWA domain-containing protein n=1 Tax=Plesiocystis pacifica SIR-1 TaxID=391625 RepID=A6GJG8_9BACT|nr:hypothetical protein PPSIR1_14450 [Plesiocystis pacifica SIR-1]